MMRPALRAKTFTVAVVLALTLAIPCRAAEIVIGDYGFSANAMVFAVALAKGFFTKAGADVTGILSSSGGGTTIRNLMAGNLAYGEAALPAILAAIQSGAKLEIISANTASAADMAWVARLDSDLQNLKDLKGKRLAFTNPGSTTQSLAVMMLDKLGLAGDVVLVKTGGLGEGLVALDTGIVDAAPVYEPVLSQKRASYRVLGSGGDVLPPLTTNVGFTSRRAADADASFISGVIAGRIAAIAFMHAEPQQSAEIIAPAFHMDAGDVRRALDNLFEIEKRTGIPFYGKGEFSVESLDNGVASMKLAGTLKGEPDWAELVNPQFLPPELRTPLK